MFSLVRIDLSPHTSQVRRLFRCRDRVICNINRRAGSCGGAFHVSPRGCGLAARRSGRFRPSCTGGVSRHTAQFRRRPAGDARVGLIRSGCPIWRQQHYATSGAARTPSIVLTGCSGNRCSGDWRDMRTSTTPTGCPSIRSCVRSWVAARSMRRLSRPRKLGGSRPRRWP